jgi:hypothetical protein
MTVSRQQLDQVAAQAHRPPLGAGALQAALRQGFQELGTALGKAFPDSIQVDTLGTLGNRVTPQEVFAQKTGRTIDIDRS